MRNNSRSKVSIAYLQLRDLAQANSDSEASAQKFFCVVTK